MNDVMDDRLRQRGCGEGGPSQTYDDGVAAGGGLRLYPLLATARKNQQTSLSTRMLYRYAHERVDQSLRDDLARYCLRHLDNGSEIQVLDRCRNCARRG